MSVNNTIPPNTMRVTLLAVCITLCILSLFMGSGNLSRHSPWVMLPICVIMLIFELKTISFSANGMSIRYWLIFINREITWERVSNVEFVTKNGSHHILISIDNCPSYAKSKLKSVDGYIFIYPLKRIVLHISEKKKDEYLDMIQQFSTVSFI